MRILSQNLAQATLPRLSAVVRRKKLDASYEALSGFLRANSVDVLCVQELADDARFDLPALPFSHRVSSLGIAVAIASRVPLSDPAGAPFQNAGLGKGVAWATVRIDGAALRVGSMHLACVSPSARRQQLADAVACSEARGSPMFLVGDTNEPRARVFKALSEAHGLRTNEPGASFPAILPALRLDRALTANGARVLDSAVVRTRLSDHRAVRFEVATVLETGR